mgnify:CR=1 FL=1|jgi:uncharacterized Fe-S cluster-containing radical SAM superfamily enzyme
MNYIIIKKIKDLKSNKELPVILLDTHGEVLEYNTIEEAEEMRARFEVNSDSGHVYTIKKIGTI